MLTKICRKVISYTVILICMSFISLGIFSKQYNFVTICLFMKFFFKSCNKPNKLKTQNFINLEYYIVFQLQSVKKSRQAYNSHPIYVNITSNSFNAINKSTFS